MAEGHVIARIGGRFWSSDDKAPVLPWIAFESTPVDPRIVAATERMTAALLRQMRALVRESYLRRAPGWLDLEPPCERDDFDFPTFRVRKRPWDWAEDVSDLPPPVAPPAAWALPQRRRMTITLRPPAAVVQR